jgi:hypothetical protein
LRGGLLAAIGELALVSLETLYDSAAAGLHARAELLSVITACGTESCECGRLVRKRRLREGKGETNQE